MYKFTVYVTPNFYKNAINHLYT